MLPNATSMLECGVLHIIHIALRFLWKEKKKQSKISIITTFKFSTKLKLTSEYEADHSPQKNIKIN